MNSLLRHHILLNYIEIILKSWWTFCIFHWTLLFPDIKTTAEFIIITVSMCRYLSRYGGYIKVLSNEWVLSGSMCRYLGMEESREMICDIIPIFLAARSGIKLCCTAVNRPRNNLNLFHRRGLETVPERRGGRHRHSFKRGVGEYCGCRYTNCPFISSISGSTVQCR